MSVLEWKKFNFFTLVGHTSKLRNIRANITAHCYNESQKVFCDENGFVHVFFRNWECVSFQASSNAIKLCALTSGNKLLVILVQEAVSDITLKVFNLQKLTKRNGAPCLGSARLTALSHASVMKACLFDNMQVCIAIGFEKGDMLLHRSAISRDMSANFISIAVASKPIRGIEFLRRDTLSYNLFVCCDVGVFCYTMTDNNSINETKIILDNEKAAPARCCTLRSSPEEMYFLVGRDDAVYYFTTDGRGPCYAIDGKKKCIGWFGNNLVLVVQSEKKSFTQDSAVQLIVVDINNKLIVFSREVNPIEYIIVENDNCYIVTNTHEVLVLRERNIQNKISLLTEKNLYDVALRLLENADNDEKSKGNILLQFGDHMLHKGDLSSATEKYIKTIGIIDPYCIIQRLIDSRYNEYLAQYLQELSQSAFATKEHLELLRSCGERLKLSENVNEICNDYPLMNSASCGGNTLYEDKIQLLQTLMKFTENEIYDFFMQNGIALIERHPDEITDVLKRISTKNASSEMPRVQCPERFIPLLMTHSSHCMDFMECIIQQNRNVDSVFYVFLLELYLRDWQKGNRPSEAVLTYIKTHKEQLNVEHIFILCRNYTFWAGILYIYESCKQHPLFVHFFLKKGDFQDDLAIANCNFLNTQTCLNVFKRRELTSANVIKLLGNILQTMLEEKKQSLLQVLQSISTNNNLIISHIKDFFNQEGLREVSELRKQQKLVEHLYKDLRAYNNMLSNFVSNPIEFRSNICDICRQQLKLPSVHYLCQHSFHKECISSYSDSYTCVSCGAGKSYETNNPDLSSYFNTTHSNPNIIESVSKALSHGVINSTLNQSTKYIEHETSANPFELEPIRTDTQGWESGGSKWIGRFNSSPVAKRPTAQISTNPFEEDDEVEVKINKIKEYDANLNPFGDE